MKELIEPERKKLNGKNRSLNDFHDEILKHILSFLPTKFAVRTCVLSRRWRFMWISLPALDFPEDFKRNPNSDRLTHRKHFMNFVDRMLILHDASPIRKFTLSCSVEDDFSRIKTWISGGVMRDVREFHFSFLPGNSNNLLLDIEHVFPLCLFNSETIEVLTLPSCYGVHLPSQIYLPRLKLLTLDCIHFEDCSRSNLLFASPALEELVIHGCTWEGDTNEIIISTPNLRKLSIDEDDYSNSISITAPELEIFEYVGAFVKGCRFPPSCSISKATLQLGRENIINMPIDHFNEVLKSLQAVKHLQLDYSFAKALTHATIPMFKNLTVLEFSIIPVDVGCKELELILNKCPRLETLIFPLGIYTIDFDALLNLKLTYIPSTLKKLMIGDIDGDVMELATVQVLLTKMTSLETMEIGFSMDIQQTKEIETILSRCTRGLKSFKLLKFSLSKY